MTELDNKTLAIKVAEKLGDKIVVSNHRYLIATESTRLCSFNQYLHDKAWQILSSEGMAGKIKDYFMPNKICTRATEKRDIDEIMAFVDFWKCNENSGTLTPQKILTLWLSMESGESI